MPALPLWAAWLVTAVTALGVKLAVNTLHHMPVCYGRRTTARMHQPCLEVASARKVLHMGMGLVFLACWALFPPHPQAHLVAASVPFMVTLQFAGMGTGLLPDDGTVAMVSRRGHRRELLGGPLQYGLLHVFATVLAWQSRLGALCLVVLCAGDGAAALVGQSLSRTARWRLAWNKQKSAQGLLAFVVAAALAWLALQSIFCASHMPGAEPLSLRPLPSAEEWCPGGTPTVVWWEAVAISSAAVVESAVTAEGWDNTAVVAAVVASAAALPR